MDMDDDFIGEIEFDLSPEQADLVSRAIGVASSSRGGDDFAQINPLIAIMSWWKAHSPEDQIRNSPEVMLVEACRRFLLAHETTGPSEVGS
jgi:hypothetical protein